MCHPRVSLVGLYPEFVRGLILKPLWFASSCFLWVNFVVSEGVEWSWGYWCEHGAHWWQDFSGSDPSSGCTQMTSNYSLKTSFLPPLAGKSHGGRCIIAVTRGQSPYIDIFSVHWPFCNLLSWQSLEELKAEQAGIHFFHSFSLSWAMETRGPTVRQVEHFK